MIFEKLAAGGMENVKRAFLGAAAGMIGRSIMKRPLTWLGGALTAHQIGSSAKQMSDVGGAARQMYNQVAKKLPGPTM